MLRKLARQYEPPYIAAVFESEGPTLREQEFAAYKAEPQGNAADLLEQIPYVRRVLEAMKIPVLEYPGSKPMTSSGTLARRAEEAGFEVGDRSSDKDMMQLVTERVSMLNPAQRRRLVHAGEGEGVPGGGGRSRWRICWR